MTRTSFSISCGWNSMESFLKLQQQVRDSTHGALAMDSRGIFDSMVRNTLGVHGPRSSRGDYELTLAVKQALACNTTLRWVAGTEMIADALTKASARHWPKQAKRDCLSSRWRRTRPFHKLSSRWLTVQRFRRNRARRSFAGESAERLRRRTRSRL